MRKTQVVADFKESYPGIIASDDYYLRQLTWSEYTDYLCKSGQITARQYANWATPACVKQGKKFD
jgi:hypothetical protein